ncbi:hypothetical protein [Tunturiibacter gelidiferens]|uniref:hypothetical protein n=1 Tax=Tunturiibacter gelidiferens TaxID=3069689 RepID=UPI003D9BD82D
MHNSWDKNDPKDAQVLLHLLKTGVTQHYHDPLTNQIHGFQELSLTYAQISLEKTRTQHRLAWPMGSSRPEPTSAASMKQRRQVEEPLHLGRRGREDLVDNDPAFHLVEISF